MARRVVGVLAMLAGLLLILPALVSARPVKIWSFQELTEKADLVIVGTAQSTADTKNYAYPDAKPDTWVAVDTVFDVSSVLKGDLKARTLPVRHYRFFGAATLIDGPCFVEFDRKLKNRYLVFLKRTEGAYEPLTGQYDPVNSFFMLQEYHVSKERRDSVSPGKEAASQGPPSRADRP